MHKHDLSRSGVSRRSFIKGAAAAGSGALLGACGLVGCSPSGVAEKTENLAETGEALPETQIYSGLCRGNCLNACFLNVHVRDGRVVRTTARDMPDTRYNRICSKGLAHVGRMYSSSRLQTPLRRVGERGVGEFEAISWDEAISEICEKWRAITDEHGKEAMAFFPASGAYGCCNGVPPDGFHMRFENAVGCSVINQDVDAAVFRMVPIITGQSQYASNNEPADYENANTIVCWGANPAVSQINVFHFILEAKDKGAKYVVIDEMFNANVAKADVFVPVKAATDGALAMGVLRELFERGWEDTEFMRAHTEAVLLVKEDGKLLRLSDLGQGAAGSDSDSYVVWDEATSSAVALEAATKPALEGVADVNGAKVRTVNEVIRELVAEYTAEKVTEITGVPPETVTEIARIYHEDGPVTTYAMFGCDHYANGHYNYWPIYAVGLCTGNSGKPGAGLGYAQHVTAFFANDDATIARDKDGNEGPGVGRTLLFNQVLNVIETGQYAGEPLTLKGCYMTCANPVANYANRQNTLNMLNAMDLVIVQDLNMTETCKYADYVLPACHWFEEVDAGGIWGTNPYIFWQEKCTEPLYESKPDFEIYKLIADGLGAGQYLDLEPEDYIKEFLAYEGASEVGLEFEKFKEAKVWRVLPGEEPFVSFRDGKFLTETGRARFYQDEVTPDYNIGQDIDFSKEHTLYWEPAMEVDENCETRKKYPYHLLSEHCRARTHTEFFECGYQDEIVPEPIVRLCPSDAAEIGVKEGDMVKLFNDRGYVVMKAVISAGLPPKTVSAPRGFQVDEFVEGHYADLPSNKYNQVCANQAFNDVAVGIEKA